MTVDDSDRVSSPVDEKAAVGAAKAAARPQLKSGSSNPNMNGPLYMQTSGSNVVLVRRLKRKDNGTWKHLARWFVENQIGMCPCLRPMTRDNAWPPNFANASHRAVI